MSFLRLFQIVVIAMFSVIISGRGFAFETLKIKDVDGRDVVVERTVLQEALFGKIPTLKFKAQDIVNVGKNRFLVKLPTVQLGSNLYSITTFYSNWGANFSDLKVFYKARAVQLCKMFGFLSGERLRYFTAKKLVVTVNDVGDYEFSAEDGVDVFAIESLVCLN